MHMVPLLVLVPALPVVSLSELSPELLLIVTATGKETYASLSVIISGHLSSPIGSKISYLLGHYSTKGTRLFNSLSFNKQIDYLEYRQ